MAKKSASGGTFERLDRGIMTALRWSAYIGAIFLMFTMLVAVIDVVLAKFLHTGIPYATEMIQYMNVAIVFFGVAYVQLDMGHTSVDLLWNYFPRFLKFGIKFLFYVLGVVVCGFFGYRAIYLLIDKYTKHTLAGGSVGFQIWPFVVILIWGFFSLAVANGWSIVRAIVDPKRYVLKEKRPDEPKKKEGAE